MKIDIKYCDFCQSELPKKKHSTRRFCDNICATRYHRSSFDKPHTTRKIKMPAYDCDFLKYNDILDDLGYDRVKPGDFRKSKRKK